MTPGNVPEPSQGNKSGWKILRAWLLVVGCVLFWIVIWAIHEKNRPATNSEPPVSLSGDRAELFAHVLVMCFLAALFLGAGIVGYVLLTLTNCLTFDFSRPVWPAVKVRVWFANLFVLMGVGLGVGFFASGILTPILTQLGVSPQLSGFLPIIGGVGVIQLLCAWILIWAPMEKRLIARRMAALGITPAQMQTGIYLGLSDPDQKSMAKRFGAIEEDVGMLWIGPDNLVYYGDSRQMNITREQLISVERMVDARSTTALSGTAHVILNFHLPDGTSQRVRLHTEGVKTMGGKRVAMESLAAKIAAWRGPKAAPIAKMI